MADGYRQEMVDMDNLCIHIIDQFRYIKIQPNTIDLGTRLWG